MVTEVWGENVCGENVGPAAADFKRGREQSTAIASATEIVYK